MNARAALRRLIKVLDRHAALALAVSGGVDSMMLAHLVHRFSTVKATMYHAHSPAVPQAALARLESHASRHGWSLVVIDAKELDDQRYVDNPVDRCYYCKSNLYTRIRQLTRDPIASGTNIDDLSDYRPGLLAATENQVVHPFVEADIDKNAVYAFAAMLGLSDLERLPAQPCLASRIETGIAVSREDLKFIDEVESAIAQQLGRNEAVRCRLTSNGVVIELSRLDNKQGLEHANTIAQKACRSNNRPFSGVRQYRRGSAFLRQPSDE